MQVHEPIWKWRTQKDKELQHHDLRDAISISMLSSSAEKFSLPKLAHISLRFSAFFIVSFDAEYSKLGNKPLHHRTCDRWWLKAGEQMHSIKCHFHGTRLFDANIWTEVKHFWDPQPWKQQKVKRLERKSNSTEFHYLMQLMLVAKFNYSNSRRRVKESGRQVSNQPDSNLGKHECILLRTETSTPALS